MNASGRNRSKRSDHGPICSKRMPSISSSESAARFDLRQQRCVCSAEARAEAAARIAFLDHSFEDVGRVVVACDGTPCLRPDGRVETTASVRVPLPLVPAFVREVVPFSVPLSATHLSTVDRFRGLP